MGGGVEAREEEELEFGKKGVVPGCWGEKGVKA
jgi:hypothetical protein